ncbi:MAG: hypothetical protein K0R00_119 [Herbinix sp.]|jgi:hypothetical protein|nr:hypothetical protein [Herbinix sp.]
MIEVKASELLDKIFEKKAEEEINSGFSSNISMEKVAEYSANICSSVKTDPEYSSDFADAVFVKVANDGYLFSQAIAEVLTNEITKMAEEEMPAEEYVEKMALNILGGFEQNLSSLEKEAMLSFEQRKELRKNRKATTKEYDEYLKENYPMKKRLKDASGMAVGAGAGALVGATIGGLRGGHMPTAVKNGAIIGLIPGTLVANKKLDDQYKLVNSDFGTEKYTDDETRKIYLSKMKNQGPRDAYEGIRSAEKAKILKGASETIEA